MRFSRITIKFQELLQAYPYRLMPPILSMQPHA